MATNYPGAIDSLTNPSAGDALDSPSHAGQHANANDAIEAVQAELGTDPAGGAATVKARFEVIEANDWVTSARIAADAVGSSEIADGAVTAPKILIGAATFGSGTGTPEGVVTAAPGSTWLQTDSTTDAKGWIKWVKATGTGNTGWVAGPEADTGIRELAQWDSAGVVTGTMPPGFVPRTGVDGAILLRRHGSTVVADMYGIQLGATNPDMPLQIVGFSSVVGSDQWISMFNGSVWSNALTCQNSGTGWVIPGTAGHFNLRTEWTWQTLSSWPTSLPGVAV